MIAQPIPKPESERQPQVHDHILRDFGILDFLKDEVDKSGELYLKVALWKVLIRIPQHCADISDGDDSPNELLKQMLVSLMAYSEKLLSEGSESGGLDLIRHGVTEQVIRENIQWMREKFLLLEMSLTQPRKEFILSVLTGGKA